ncbi:MAG: Do family serine endopeptidase [Nitrospinales bacterium]
MFKKIVAVSTAIVLFLLMGFPFSSGTQSGFSPVLKQADAFTGGPNPVGSNIVVEIAKKENPAVVYVSTKTKRKEVARNFGIPGLPDPFRGFGPRGPRRPPRGGTGSGFIIDPEGLVMTNNHVVEGAEEINIKLENEKEYKAELIGTDKKTDIALLKLIRDKDDKGPLPYLRMGDSDKLEVGEWVVAIGNPFGLSHTVTVGVVSAKGRNIGAGPYDEFIQTDASINPGNSGGPLINMNGEVVGMNTAILSGNTGGNVGIGFAIPINLAKGILKHLKKEGKVTRGWLGVMIQKITPELQKSFGLAQKDGALVGDVIPNSPASAAGVKRGDVIIKFDNHEIKKMENLPKVVAGTPPGKPVEVEVIRDGKNKMLSITIALLKEDEGRLASLGDPLGLQVQDITPELAQSLSLEDTEGVLVSSVKPGEPAAEAGLRRGDVIAEVNRKPVRSLAEYKGLIAHVKSGTVLLLVKRNGSSIFIAVKLG